MILGQDPYHAAGQAHGLSFSVRAGVRVPPSLRNVFKELRADLGVDAPTSGDLTGWAEQGVLLLNTVLTVRAGQPGSHARQGWEHVTDAAIRALDARPERVVFLLWGAHAQKKKALRHLDPSRGAGGRASEPDEPAGLPRQPPVQRLQRRARRGRPRRRSAGDAGPAVRRGP